MAAAEKTCPGCGTANHPGAAYCNLCQEPFALPGISRLAEETAGDGARPAAPVPRAAPMLSFYEAASRNVRLSLLRNNFV